ncbi:DUF833 domain protein [Xylona heveae TC161]|uniref:DUF833 domain protein n=1 Tax=Xylona heveae (strain CBS 132557 / TC161) TaxID=1328760 RepID=A0A165GYH9_XYLHT|nr:DUF833 domain protein [Xylona heveae TC161]KZF22762.1 DUF833 domain protein [Xylona heveae TC161]
MCIALISTNHPSYHLVLLDNRDEYIGRPTAPARFWDEPHADVLAGRDLMRSEQGTWLGITRQGRIAVLTNFREEEEELLAGARSRGAMVSSFLAASTQPSPSSTPAQQARSGSARHLMSTQDFVNDLVEDHEGLRGVGGFSLVCGVLRKNRQPLAVVSNRTPRTGEVPWIGKSSGETRGLSNTTFEDHTWPKVLDGEHLLDRALAESHEASESKQQLLDRLVSLLNTDTLPRKQNGETWVTYTRNLRRSIFVPVFEGEECKPADAVAAASDESQLRGKNDAVSSQGTSGLYGTVKQTIVLVDHDGRVTYLERTLFGDDGTPIPAGQGDRIFEFDIDGWDT